MTATTISSGKSGRGHARSYKGSGRRAFTPDHVVASALRFVFWKDKEFDRLQKDQKKTRKTYQPAEVKKL